MECLEREVASAREVERVLEHRLKEVRPFVLLSFCPFVLLSFFPFVLLSFCPFVLLSFYPFVRGCWLGGKVVMCVYTSGC